MSSVVSFGAFVDLGGMDGLIHVSELSWKHVDHPGSVVAVGDKVKVQVLDVDMSRERISLSLKATQDDPWQEFAEGHEVGQLVYGRVTKLVQFGAFVQVGDGIEGLVHISEMSTHHVDSPEQVVTPGEELWVKIIDLDLARRRISLSIKQAAEGGELADEYREHFEVDEQGNWASSSEEVEAAWAEFENADAGVADAPAAADEPSRRCRGAPTVEADAVGRSRRGRRRRGLISVAARRPDGRHRRRQVDGLRPARRAGCGDRRRRPDRTRPAAHGLARRRRRWPSASALRSCVTTGRSTVLRSRRSCSARATMRSRRSPI